MEMWYSEKTIYKYEDCSGCPYKSDCIKGNNCKTPLEERTKTLQAAKTFLKYREEDLERILSEEGILLRINRNIQVEGSFGDIKQDMQFRRYVRLFISGIRSITTAIGPSASGAFPQGNPRRCAGWKTSWTRRWSSIKGRWRTGIGTGCMTMEISCIHMMRSAMYGGMT